MNGESIAAEIGRRIPNLGEIAEGECGAEPTGDLT
jgi:hypothetical protein